MPVLNWVRTRNSQSTAIGRIIAVVLLVAASVAPPKTQALDAPSEWLGLWKLNLERSRLDSRVPNIEGQLLRVEALENVLTLAAETTLAGGRTVSEVATVRMSGETTPGPVGVTVSFTRTGRLSFDVILRQASPGSEVVGTNRFEFSASGETLTETKTQTFSGAKPVTSVLVFERQASQGSSSSLLSRVDHLVYASPDLQRGIDRIEQVLGVKATPGGQHPGRGTRNALVALGPSSYLEIIGPDPEQPTPALPRPFGIDGLKEPRLVTWAVKGTNLDALARDAARNGVKLGEVIAGSRRRADGVLLTWRYTDPRTVVADGVVPFVIDWGETPHPARTATPGATLVDLSAEHPDPDPVKDALKHLGIEVRVQRGPRVGLIAAIDSPRGRVELQ